MQLVFRQRFFSWFDSYDIYDETGGIAFTVQGRLSFGHDLLVADRTGSEVAELREELFHLLPHFRIFKYGQYAGQIVREFTLLRPVYRIEYSGWRVEGDILGWDFDVLGGSGTPVAHLSKQLLHLTDTYILEIADPACALDVLMIALAIDAAACTAAKNS